MEHDDASTEPFQLSHAAWDAVIQGADHMTAAFDMALSEVGPKQYLVTTRPYAPYALMRASLEASLRALWLLGGETRSVRVGRRLRMRLTDAKNFDRGLKIIPGVSQQPIYESTLRRAEVVADAANVGRSTLRKDVTPTEIMLEGSRGASSGTGDLVFIWRSLSALMHGDQWAARNFLDQPEVPELSDSDVVAVQSSSSIDSIAVHLGICLRWAEESVALFVRRKTEPEG